MTNGVAPGQTIPDHVNLKLDPTMRVAIQDFMVRMRLANRSDAFRTLLAAGLNALSATPESAELVLTQAAYVNAKLRGIAAIKSSLPALFAAAMEKLDLDASTSEAAP